MKIYVLTDNRAQRNFKAEWGLSFYIEFESKETNFVKEDGSLDFVEDDSGIVIKTDKVYAVLGGFHLKGGDETTLKTIEYLKDMNITYIKTSHCTKFPALIQFANTFGSKPYGAGEIIEI